MQKKYIKLEEVLTDEQNYNLDVFVLLEETQVKFTKTQLETLKDSYVGVSKDSYNLVDNTFFDYMCSLNLKLNHFLHGKYPLAQLKEYLQNKTHFNISNIVAFEKNSGKINFV